VSTTPAVSIICPFINAERFLAEAIDSVVDQEFGDFELLLIDDGSSDSSTEIARTCADRDPRVRYMEHPKHANRGASPSRNLGWAQARGEYIAFIDSDDVWRRGKLGAQVEIMKAHPSAGMVCGTVNYWSSWAGGKDRLVPTGNRREGLSQPLETILDLYPLGDAAAPCPSDVLIRRHIVEERPFEERFVGPGQIYEDQVLFVKVYLAAPVYFSTDVWLDYRQHPDSCVSTVARDGLYGEVRAEFLRWFRDYAVEKDVADSVLDAIERAQHDLAHPVAARLKRFGRRIRAAASR
jgi:glycosyltransferase involved in cell wall biosynthesis